MNKKIVFLRSKKFIMIKKIIALEVLLVMFFSLVACNKDNEFADYKNDAKRIIETYAESYVEVNVDRERMSELVIKSKADVDVAENKDAVDKAVDEAKTAIDEICDDMKEIEPGFYVLKDAYVLGSLKQNDLRVLRIIVQKGLAMRALWM